MSTNQTWGDFGREVRNAVQDALQSGDFQKLGDVVTNVAGEAVKIGGEQVGQVINSLTSGARENYTEKWIRENNERKAAAQGQNGKNLPARAFAAPFQKKGSVSGTLFQVFGGIGAGVLGVLSVIFLGLGIAYGGGFGTAFWVLAIFLGFSVGMIRLGVGQKRRLKRAMKYRELAGHNHYINLEELAMRTNRSLKYVRKDVKKMLEDGFFPEGHLDRQETCLMLDEKIYGEYLSLEKQRKAQALAIPQKPEAPEKPAAKASSEVDSLIAEGQDYIRKLRDMNDNIAGESISAKLFRLESLLKQIFDRLREHPEQASQMQKFMSYYLPTTLKLVAAYEEFDTLSEQGGDIVEAKEEIEKTLDTINSAFSELLNRLFREAAYDVTTDAQVLQTMLAQEGLTREPELEFAKRKV